MSSLRELRPHQVRALDGLKWSLVEGKRRPLLQAPTGAGKTVIAAHIVAGARRKGKRIAFCVPALSLVDQTFERFRENGIDPADMGVLQGDHPWRRPNAPIQIATAQTLARRDLPDVDIVVIDEAHVQYSIYDRWMALPEWKDRPFIGLTATPWAKGLGKKFDALVKPTSLAELIEGGYLAPFRVFAPSHPDLTGVKTVAGDYHEGQLAERMNRPVLVADIVSTWLTKGEGRPTLCFATGRAHAQAIRDQFASAGVAVAYVDANTPREEREAIGRQLADGAIKVVVNIGCLTTGIDWDVRCLILARPTKSESLFVQIIGRALRTAEGKTDAIILDHSDTHLRLGLVTDIDFDELDDGAKGANGAAKKREKSIPLPWECKGCAAVVPAGLAQCTECGHTRRPRNSVDHVDGDLAELTANGANGRRRSGGDSVTETMARWGKAAVYAMLRGMALERGRSDGWVAHQYREIFGVWPRGLDREEAIEPAPLLRSWIRSRNIAYAKRMQAEKEGRAHA